MPTLDITENQQIRHEPYAVRKYLSVAPRNVLFSAQVSGAVVDTDNGTVYAMGYTGATGTAASCKRDMSLWVGTAPGRGDICKTRMRKPINEALLQVYITETPSADIPFVSGTNYITVYEEFPMQIRPLRLQAIKTNGSKVPNNFIEFHDYDIPYVNQNRAIPPIVNVYSRFHAPTNYFVPVQMAGWVDDDQIFRTVNLILNQPPNGSSATTVSITWDLKDGTMTVNNFTFSEITATFPVGFRYISVTMVQTDGATTVRYVPIWVHDDVYLPIGEGDLGFQITSDTTDTSRTLDVTIDGINISETEVPKGAMFLMWKEYEHTMPVYTRDQFLGWALDETAEILYEGKLSLKIGNSGAWLKELQGFGTRINDTGTTPTKWYEMQTITLNKFIHYLLREYTTALNLCNFVPNIASVFAKPQAETANRASIFEQCNGAAAAYGMQQFASDSTSQLIIKTMGSYRTSGNYNTTDERSTNPTILTIEAEDWSDENPPSVVDSEFRFIGRTDSTAAFWQITWKEPQVVASRAPSKIAGSGTGTDDLPFQRIDTSDKSYAQSLLNTLVGLHYARKNGKFQNFEIALSLPFDVVEPSWQEYIKISYSEDNVRGYTFPYTDYWVVNSIQISHSEPGYEDITWSLERVEDGPPGITIEILKPEQMKDPFWEYYFKVNPALPNFNRPAREQIDVDEPTGTLIGYAIAVDRGENEVARTFNFISGPNWETITPPGMVGILQCGAGRLENENFVIRVAAYNGTSVRVYYCSDGFADTPAWLLEDTFTLVGANFNGIMRMRSSFEEDFWALAWLAEDGVRIRLSNTYGAWSAFNVGDVTATDLTIAESDIGLTLENDRVLCCGKDGSNIYRVYETQGIGSFVQTTGTPSHADPFCLIKLRGNGGSGYAAVFKAYVNATRSLETSISGLFNTTVEVKNTDNTVFTGGTLGAFNHNIRIRANVAPSDLTGMSAKGQVLFTDDIPLLSRLELTPGYSVLYTQASPVPPATIANTIQVAALTYKVTLNTESHGSYIRNVTRRVMGMSWAPFSMLGPYVYISVSTIEDTGDSLIFEDLVRIQSAQISDFKPISLDFEVTFDSVDYNFNPSSVVQRFLTFGAFPFVEYYTYLTENFLYSFTGAVGSMTATDITPDDGLTPWGFNALSILPDGEALYLGKRFYNNLEFGELRRVDDNGELQQTYNLITNDFNSLATLNTSVLTWGAYEMAAKVEQLYFASRRGDYDAAIGPVSEIRDLLVVFKNT